jgi:hypothetical protein
MIEWNMFKSFNDVFELILHNLYNVKDIKLDFNKTTDNTTKF